MASEILDGRKLSSEIEEEIRLKVEKIKKEGGKTPHLAAILVGTDGPSQTYVENKVKACHRVGFESTLLRFSESISQSRLIKEVTRINEDDDIDGLIVQLPLPDHISEEIATETISPLKDVDGFTNQNYGQIIREHHGLLPATPNGVMEMIKRYGIETKGKHAVIVGHSRLVGAPLGLLLSHEGMATVTQCHEFTEDLAKYTRQADILCVAVGKPGLITGDMVKDGVVVIDIGISRVEDPSKKRGFRLSGDVEFDSVSKKASYITPVPGGVGPMTIASLLMNTLKASKLRNASQ